MTAMKTLHEPARDIPIAGEFDLCVIGGSCTGVFAALSAARMGASVALIECQGVFGGTATAGRVCLWHSFLDAEFQRPIMAGLGAETIERLQSRDAILTHANNAHKAYVFAPAEMILVLDQMIHEQPRIRPFLHARFVAPIMGDAGNARAAVIEDKSGRRAVCAKLFIDASGDADFVHRAGLETFRQPHLQPPTVCAVLQGVESLTKENPAFNIGQAAFDKRYPERLPPGFLWTAPLPGRDMLLVAGTRVRGADCSDADELTQAEMEGRRQVRAIVDILRKRIDGGRQVTLQDVAPHIGIRQTRQSACLHQLTEQEVLHGTRFDDAIANGSYRVDIHFPDREGILFRYLDGREDMVFADRPAQSGRWRPADATNPTFYQIPYRSLIPRRAVNILCAGRCVDADRGAYGAIRVQVNCNQLGQAAGTAACLAMNAGNNVAAVDARGLREELARTGAVIL